MKGDIGQESVPILLDSYIAKRGMPFLLMTSADPLCINIYPGMALKMNLPYHEVKIFYEQSILFPPKQISMISTVFYLLQMHNLCSRCASEVPRSRVPRLHARRHRTPREAQETEVKDEFVSYLTNS